MSDHISLSEKLHLVTAVANLMEEMKLDLEDQASFLASGALAVLMLIHQDKQKVAEQWIIFFEDFIDMQEDQENRLPEKYICKGVYE